MATSDSFNTTSEGNFYFTVLWRRTGYDIVKNEHYIDYSVVAHNTPGNHRTVYNKSLVINGNVVYSAPGGNQYQDGNLVTSGSVTVHSYNEAGNGSLSMSFEAGVGTTSGTNVSGSGNWELDQIPRISTPIVTCSVVRGLDTISASMVVTNDGGAPIIDRYIDLFTDSSCTNKIGVIGESGTFIGLNPNTTYYARANASNGTYRGYSQVVTVSTYDIAKITSVPNINLGDNLTVQYSNPSGASIQIGIFKTDGTTALSNYRACSGSSYTFTFTDTELDNIYKQYGNANSITTRVYIKTNNTYYNYGTFTITLKGNQKTIKTKVNNNWKRGKVYVKVSDNWKKGVVWTKVNGTWERSI